MRHLVFTLLLGASFFACLIGCIFGMAHHSDAVPYGQPVFYMLLYAPVFVLIVRPFALVKYDDATQAKRRDRRVGIAIAGYVALLAIFISLWALSDLSQYDIFPSRAVARVVLASAKGDLDGIRSYVAAGGSLNVSGKYGKSPLATAVNRYQLDAVRLLLELGADPNYSPPGNPSLNAACMAISRGWEYREKRGPPGEDLALMLKHGLDPNLLVGDSRLVNHVAINGRPEDINTLADAGADFDRPNAMGQTGLEYAVRGARWSIAIEILKHASPRSIVATEPWLRNFDKQRPPPSEWDLTMMQFRSELIRRLDAIKGSQETTQPAATSPATAPAMENADGAGA